MAIMKKDHDGFEKLNDLQQELVTDELRHIVINKIYADETDMTHAAALFYTIAHNGYSINNLVVRKILEKTSDNYGGDVIAELSNLGDGAESVFIGLTEISLIDFIPKLNKLRNTEQTGV